MKKILGSLLIAVALVSCDDFYLNHQLGGEPPITVVRNFTYTLSDADYSAVASNATNVATSLAMGKNETDSSVYNRLKQLGTDKYFSDTLITPELFLPAFMANKYPQLSSGTLCEVTYRTVADLPVYFSDFDVIREFYPSSPLASVDEIIPALDAQVNKYMKREGYKFIVYFSDDKTYLYQYTNGAFKPYTSSGPDVIVFADADYREIGADVVANPESTLNIYLNLHFPYAADGKTLLVIYRNADRQTAVDQFTYDLASKTWNILPKITDESMSFEMKDAWKANTSTYLSEPFLGHGQGDFMIQNVYLEAPLTYVWYYSSTYGMCASGYKDNASHKSEAWLVSPVVKLKKATKPQLIFDQAFNKADNFTEEATVLVSSDYKGDVTTCTWTPLEWNKKDDGTLNVPAGTSWVFQSSGDMDLTPYVGKSVYIAFRYTSASGKSGSWELKNVLVYEPESKDEK